MARVELKGINRVTKRLASGGVAVYHYHRATGIKLQGAPGSPEFLNSYVAAESTVKARHAGEAFNRLIRSFTASPEFEALSPGTRAEYRRMLTKAEPEFGTMPIAALNDPRVRKDFMTWRAKVAKVSGPREGDNRLSVISAMLTWGVENGEVLANHLKGFTRLYHADRAEIIWLPEHIEAFMKVAPLELQRALILALHTGQRQADLLRLPWSAYDGAEITLRQGKARRGGKQAPLIHIPCTKALRRMLDGMKREGLLVLTTKTGRALKKRYFARQWEEASKAAKLDAVTLPGSDETVTLHFHDLRGTAVTLLSESGSTPQQIAPITGHSVKTVHTILERYLARTRGLAEQAIFNWESSGRAGFYHALTATAENNSGAKLQTALQTDPKTAVKAPEEATIKRQIKQRRRRES